MSRQRLLLFVAVVVLAVLALACSRERRITSAEAESSLPPTSPEKVLQNIAYAYQTLDFDLYRDQFDPSLKLVFPDEIMAYMEGQPQPDYEWDMTSTENLFGDSDWIKFEMVFDPPGPSTVEGYPADQDFVEIKAHSVQIDIKRKGEDLNWIVTDEAAVLVMKKNTSVDPATYKVVYMHYLGNPEETAGE